MGWFKNLWYWPKKHKEYAGEFWSQAAGRAYDKGQALMNQPGAANKLLGVLSKSDALAYYGAAAAADLASESLGGWGLDLASMGKGKLLSKAAAGAANLLVRTAKPGGTAAKVLATATDLAHQWSDPASALFRGRKAFKLGSTASRAIRGTGGGQPEITELVRGWKPPYREPFRQLSLDIHPELPRARPGSQPFQRRPAQWGASFVDPVKLAATQLMGPQPGSLQWMAQGLSRPGGLVTQPPLRARRLGPHSGSLQWMAQGLRRPGGLATQPPLRARPLRPQPGSLQWMAQGLRSPGGLATQPPLRARPLRPQPGSLQWMAQGLRRPAGLATQPPLRARPLGPQPGSLQWMAQGIR